MKFPYSFIESKNASNREFALTCGVQPTYALLFLREGSFRLQMDGKDEILSDGDCAIFPDHINFVRTVISPISFIQLNFKPNEQCPFSLPIPLGKVIFRNTQRFLDNIETYEKLMNSTDPQAICIKEHLLHDILLQAFMENQGLSLLNKKAAPDQIRDRQLAQAVSFIQNNLHQKLTVRSICQAAHTNPSTLNFKFQKEFKLSTGNFVLKERMERARFLLANTTHPIGHIATRCGYDNIFHFSATFRRIHNISPSHYRNEYQ